MFGNYDFKPSPLVRKDRVAYKRYKELVELYREGEIAAATTAISALLDRYCLTFSEYDSLQKTRRAVKALGWDEVRTYHTMLELKLEQNINKKLDMLLKYEKELGLTLFSKLAMANQVKKTEKETEAEKAGFGNL